ncbi:uncharacterized protein LOC135808733 [Sycon ciliatum]|uniref:uncharacterized protein LOC135808733 n=1 Tax=Sycon ciliatum TaxID=27933 RepID=UPI0020A8D061|eukprot:scpid36876/ scgid15853/ 1-phosphatidylinositol 3-phosphate 5-kinase; FYVE finger-containing phosphoinositide kinase; PIKfyve; Phosphatidylinositol 3-phosphate 5-kinase type III
MGGLCSCLNDNEEDADETTTLISGRPSATISKASHSSTSTFSANHCPEEFWVPDDEASECQYCKRGFSATNRRHHCRMCGDVFHGGECSTPRGPTDHRVWVCRFCYDYYHKFKNTLFHGAQFILHREEGISETVVMKLEGEGVDMCVRWTPTKQTLKSKMRGDQRMIMLQNITSIETGARLQRTGDTSCCFRIVTSREITQLEALSYGSQQDWVAGLRAAVFVCSEDCRLLAVQKEAHVIQRAERKKQQGVAKQKRKATADSIVGKYRDRPRRS